MRRHRRPSPQTRAVLEQFLSDAAEWRHGYDLSTALDIASGSLYPILMRLADRGYLESRWDHGSGRPRHLYRLTGTGTRYALEAVRPAESRRSRIRPAEGLS